MAVAVRDDGGRKSVRWRELVLHGLCGDDLARVDASSRAGGGRSFELLSFGGGYQGQLGVGKAKAANRAAQVEFPEGEEPRHVACGGSFSAAVTSAGRVYTWGSNKHGQLGYKLAGVGGQQPLPAQVGGALAAVQVMAIACGREHALALGFDGGLYSWGSGKHGQLGHGDHHSHQEPRKLEEPELSFSRIATGDQHSAALSRDGKLYTWGHGGWGELGHGEPPLRGPELLEELRPKRVEAIADVACAALTCGPQQTAVISRLGQVFLCGSVGRRAAEPGSLAADSFLFTPQRLELGPEAGPAQQVALGKSHILLLTRAGDVYSVGSGAHGQLGHGSKGDLATPQLVLRGKKIVHIAAGRYHSTAITAHGSVFSWGSGEHGQLCHGADSGEIIPRLVDDLLHRVVLCTACADCHTVALCTGPLDRPGQLSREMVETSAREHEEYEMKMAMGSAKSGGAGKQRLRTVLSAVHKLASSRAAGPDEPAEAREAAQLTEPPTPAADHKAEISALLSAPEGEALEPELVQERERLLARLQDIEAQA